MSKQKIDPFLRTLLAADNAGTPSYAIPKFMAGTSTPVPRPSAAGTAFNFATYFNNKANHLSSKPSSVGLASQGEKDERGIMSKTFGWLGSLGTGVENLALDVLDKETQGDPGAILRNMGRDLAATVAHVAQPVIDAGPIHTPWEDAVAKFTFNNNVKHGGKEYTSGSEILKELGINNKIVRGLGGFAVDVGSDPLTYAGGFGLLSKGKKAVQLAEDAIRGTEGEKAALAVERGRQAAQEAGFAKPSVAAPVPPTATRIATEAQVPEEIQKIISEVPTSVKGASVAASPLNPGLARVFANKGIAQTKRGSFNPLAVQKVINDVARQGGTLAPVATPVAAAEGARGAQALSTARAFASKAKLTGQVLKPKDQARLFDHLYQHTAGDLDVLKLTGNNAETSLAKSVRAEFTVPMMKRAEDDLASQGFQFHDWNGSGLKLSDVASEIPKEKFGVDLPKVVKAFKQQDLKTIKDPDVQDYVANALARRNLAIGTVSKDMYDKLAVDAARQQVSLSPARYRDWLNGEAQRAYEAARPLGFTNKEAQSLKDLFVHHTDMSEVDMMDPYDLIDRMGSRAARAFYDGKRDKGFIQGLNKAIAKSLGQPHGTFGKITKPINDVEDSMAKRLTTWSGRGSMIHKARSEFSAAQNWAKYRNNWIGDIRKNYTNEEVNNGWLSLMRPIDQIVEGKLDPRTMEIGQKFRDYFENIIGPESPLGKEVAQSTAINSQMIAADLNRHLGAVGSKFRVKPDKAGNWLDSVLNYKVLGKKSEGVDPTTFLYNFDLAVQRTLAEYNLVDDFAMRFGKIPGQQGFDRLEHTHAIPHERAAGYKFNKDQAQQFTNLLEDLRKGSWRPGSRETQLLTTGLRKWKSGVTIYYPAHHIRNLIGDTWLMWASGINNPRVFDKALKVIGSQRGRYSEAIKNPELAKLQNMIEPGSTGWAQTEGKHIVTNKGGSNITADEFYHEALSRGILLDAQRIEDLQGEALRGGRSLGKPFKGEVHAAISQISEYREHYIRLAHLIGYVEKHMPASVAKKLASTEGPLDRSKIMSNLFDRAAEDIRKWHPDGTDLSYWEQKYARNVMPFYSWMRKAIPLTLESMMLKPAKVTAYPRAMFGLQGMLGVNAPGPTQPFPEDQLYPDWMVGGGIGPIGNPDSTNPFAHFFGVLGTNAETNGKETGYTVIDPGRGALPSGMIGQLFGKGSPGETWKGLIDMTSPLFRIPAELATGTKTSGAPITGPAGDGLLPYFAGVMPQTAPLQRFLPGMPLLGKQGQENREPGPNWEALINALTGAGLTGTGKYTKSAEYDARDRAIKEKKKK